MNILKASITLSAITVMVVAYLTFPTEDEQALKSTITSSSQATSPQTKSSQSPHKILRRTEHSNQDSSQTSLTDLEVAFHFENTSAYEAASTYGNLPTSMADIHIEKFSYNENGQLIINENIKHIVEFFLMATQEEGREQAIARLNEYIDMTLPSDAAKQALVIAQNYLSYKNSIETPDIPMNSELGNEETLKKLKAALADKKSVRRQHLGEPVSEVLFGHEERYDDFSLSRLEINANTALSDDEKDQHIAQAENDLPPAMAQKMRSKRQEKNLLQKIDRLKEEGGNSQEIHALRATFYGQKAADRMAYLEDNSDAWQEKVSQFYREQDFISEQIDLNKDQKSQLISDAKNSIFTPKEQIKLAVQSIRGGLAQAN